MKIKFDCGCVFEGNGNSTQIDYNSNDINLECSKTWNLISDGNTKGVFQLESRLGQSMAKKLKPDNIEHLSALISIMRPGCISGDTKIFVSKYKHTDGRMRFKKEKIRNIVKNYNRFKTLVSYDEQTGRFVSNTILNAFYTGDKECFRVVIRTNERKKSDYGNKEYKLECTADHKLLTPEGWKELKDIKINERVLVSERKGTKKPGLGSKTFRQRCFTGNRFINNDHDNLCYMCPNHHREFTEGHISVEQVNKQKIQYKLPKTIDGKWCKLVGKISVGVKDVYDISMKSPHHNFIAGGVIVHNCLEAFRDGKSVSNHFIDRKNGQESIDYFNPALEPILKNTYGEMVYQEQAMEIAKEIAGFDLQEADMLRKAIGKKKPEEMVKIKQKFLDGAESMQKVSKNEAEQIFGWIEKSQRYSFNKSHAVSYAINGYMSAHAKAHFPTVFFLSYLRLAKDKIDPHEEISELISNAKSMDINVFGPDLRFKNKEFEIIDNKIYFGLTNIKGLGDSVFTKLSTLISDKDLSKLSWEQTLLTILLNINSTAAKSLIQCGALDYHKISRSTMLHHYNLISELTNKEIEHCINAGQQGLDIIDMMKYLLSIPRINQKRKTRISELLNQIINPPYSLEDNLEWIADNEKQILGASITCTKTDSYDSSYANTDCKDIKNFATNKQFFIIAEIDSINIITTKRGKNPGQEMCFMKISDSYGAVDCIMFPEEFGEHKKLLEQGRVLMFSGQKSQKDSSVIVKKCFTV